MRTVPKHEAKIAFRERLRQYVTVVSRTKAVEDLGGFFLPPF